MKSIYLVQRGKIYPKILEALSVKGAVLPERLSQTVNFDYMGSAEFEFGALPESFRGLEKCRSSWSVRMIEEITDDGKPLLVFSGLNDVDFVTYKAQLITLRKPRGENRIQTKEYTDFMESTGQRRKDTVYGETNFWWDIENHVMFSFVPSFMDNISNFVGNSLQYMNSQKK